MVHTIYILHKKHKEIRNPEITLQIWCHWDEKENDNSLGGFNRIIYIFNETSWNSLLLRLKTAIQWNNKEIQNGEIIQNMHGVWEQSFVMGMMYESQPQKRNTKVVMGAEV